MKSGETNKISERVDFWKQLMRFVVGQRASQGISRHDNGMKRLGREWEGWCYVKDISAEEDALAEYEKPKKVEKKAAATGQQ